LDALADALAGIAAGTGGASRGASRAAGSDSEPPARQAGAAVSAGAAAAASLREAADAGLAAFDDAVDTRDTDAATQAVLDLEAAIVDWSADTEQSDDTDYARRTLRAMVVRLGALARDGLSDPAERIEPFVMLLLQRRQAARDARDWPAADAIRDGLLSVGIEVRDTPGGVTWHLRDSS
jgi:cysteinyl-tRNA synthetase